jgi:anaerobic magnesium-protoporphyrin IX monomethyl ester cyclase
MGKRIMLVAYQDQDNLGVGYLASVVLEAGFHPIIIDYRLGPEKILELAQHHQPLVIGFSIIFQFHTPDFQQLMRYLRGHGVECHFTAGGHYPSLRWREVLQAVPELDSIVRFEGEWTFLDLIKSLDEGHDWTGLDGLAYRSGEDLLTNPPRPLELDLDRFPPPLRPPLRREILGRKEVTLIAGRGCLYNCSFCSIRQFYSPPPGPLKRVRCPEMVVREMELLHEQYQASIFLFQDDDFPATARNGRDWANRFARLLHDTGLDREVLWKINCRADEVEEKRFAMLHDAGLLNVYLGIESGTSNGLELMNKHTKPETNLRAVEVLRKLGLNCDFGFMIFDPLSTLESVGRNLDFLDQLCGDGYTAVTGCKMIPYAETAIEKWLQKEGRLKVSGEYENYHFLSPEVETLYGWFIDTFANWIEGPTGVLTESRRARYSLSVHQRVADRSELANDLEREITEIVSAANHLFTDAMREAICALSGGYSSAEQSHRLDWVQLEVSSREQRIRSKIGDLIKGIEQFSAGVPDILAV